MEGFVDVINAASGLWAASMWTALWQSTLMAAAVFLVGVRFKKLAPAVRYWLWMFVGLRLLVMPFLTVELPVIPATEQPVYIAGAQAGATVGAPRNPSMEINSSGPPASGFEVGQSARLGQEFMATNGTGAVAAARTVLTWKSVVMLLWCAGFLVVLSRLARSCIRTRRLIARARFDDLRLRTLTRRAAEIVGRDSVLPVGASRANVGPFVYGAWRPVVILPDALVREATDNQLLVVLVHEYAHAQRRDPLLGWVFALCHALYFFHPVLHFVKRQLLLERERACDDLVLALSEARPSTYAKVLVKVASLCRPGGQPIPALIAGESFQDLRFRIHGLRKDAASRKKLSPVASVLLIVVGVLSVPGVAFTDREAEAVIDRVAAGRPALPPDARESTTETGRRVSKDTEPTRVAVANDGPPAAEASVVPTRTLRFPPHLAVGGLKVRDKSHLRRIDEYWCWTDDTSWSSFGIAQGDVEVPVDKDVWLTLNINGISDTAFLRNMQPDDIYRLSTLYAKEGEASLDDKGMEEVAKLTGLRHLELRYSNVTDRGLKLLQEHPQLERIETPREMTDDGLAYISDIGTLRGLYIHTNALTDTGMVHVKKLQALEEMILGGGSVTDSGLIHLTKLPKLGYLMLWGMAFRDAGMLHVANMPALTIANLSNQELTNRGVQYLSGSPSIETLSLYGVKHMTGLGLQHLSKLRTLKKLNLSCPPGVESNLNSYSMKFLAGCTSLETLDTPRNVDDAALAEIAKLPKLKVLRVWNTSNAPGITDQALLSVAAVEGLQELFIAGGGVTDVGLAAVAGMQHLVTLNIMTESRDITNQGIAELASLTKLRHLDLQLNKRANVTLTALSQLNALTALTHLRAVGFHQDDSVLDLSRLVNLDDISFYVYGGLHDEDLACLSELKNIRWLQGVTGITDEGVSHIAELKALDRLNIAGEGLTDKALAQLQSLTAMDTLSIEGAFTDRGIQQLGALKSLHWLTVISDPPLGNAAQEQLLSALPNVTVYNNTPLAGRAAAR